MNYRIEITDSKATLVGANGYGKEITTDKLFDSFQPPAMIPVSLRWYDPIRDIYVFEYPPGHRIIHKEAHQDPYRIPVPWQVYVCSTNPRDVRMYMRTEQLGSLDDMLYHQFMSNIYRSGTPCQGPRGEVYDNDPIATCRAMIDGIWMTTFNGGCYISTQGYKAAGATFKDVKGCLMPDELIKAGFNKDFWSYAKNEPTFHEWMEEHSIEEILEWNFKSAGTVKELVEYLATDLGKDDVWGNITRTFGRLDAKTVKR